MSRITPTMALECKLCGHRPSPESVIEAFVLHMQVEHDVDEVALDLRAICSCGTSMVHVGSKGKADHFKCEPCGNIGTVFRR